MSPLTAIWPNLVPLATDLRETLNQLITWVVGPGLLIGMLAAAYALVESSAWDDDEHEKEDVQRDRKITRIMAFSAGVLGSLIVMIRDILVKQFAFPDSMTDSDMTKFYVIIFLVLGFAVTAVSSFVKISVTSSLLIFILAFASITAFYFYVTMEDVRGPILIASTSLSTGVLVCFWWIPASRRAFINWDRD